MDVNHIWFKLYLLLVISSKCDDLLAQELKTTTPENGDDTAREFLVISNFN